MERNNRMKNFLKKLFGIALIVMMIIMTGCGNSNDNIITVISREDGSGTRGAFVDLTNILEKKADGTKTDKTTIEAIIVSKTDVMLLNVARDKGAIGYVSLGSLNDKIKAVKIDSVEANAENISNGSYALARPFNITYGKQLSEAGKEFVSFILSREGQEVVSSGYVKVDNHAADFLGSKASGKVVVSGSSSVAPVMEKLIEAFAIVNPKIKIELQTSDSTSGIQGSIDGTCDIGMSSRDIQENEKEKLDFAAIALDGIVVVVNLDNQIDDLTMEEVNHIFTGQIDKWDQITK